jgi:hypothetical protein
VFGRVVQQPNLQESRADNSMNNNNIMMRRRMMRLSLPDGDDGDGKRR